VSSNEIDKKREEDDEKKASRKRRILIFGIPTGMLLFPLIMFYSLTRPSKKHNRVKPTQHISQTESKKQNKPKKLQKLHKLHKIVKKDPVYITEKTSNKKRLTKKSSRKSRRGRKSIFKLFLK
jgi:hypothetical protein